MKQCKCRHSEEEHGEEYEGEHKGACNHEDEDGNMIVACQCLKFEERKLW